MIIPLDSDSFCGVLHFLCWREWTALRNCSKCLRLRVDNEFILPETVNPEIGLEYFGYKNEQKDTTGFSTVDFVIPTILKLRAQQQHAPSCLLQGRLLRFLGKKQTAFAIFQSLWRSGRQENDKVVGLIQGRISCEMGLMIYKQEVEGDPDVCVHRFRVALQSEHLDSSLRKECAACLAFLLSDNMSSGALVTSETEIFNSLKLAASLGDEICARELGYYFRTGQF